MEITNVVHANEGPFFLDLYANRYQIKNTLVGPQKPINALFVETDFNFFFKFQNKQNDTIKRITLSGFRVTDSSDSSQEMFTSPDNPSTPIEIVDHPSAMQPSSSPSLVSFSGPDSNPVTSAEASPQKEPNESTEDDQTTNPEEPMGSNGGNGSTVEASLTKSKSMPQMKSRKQQKENNRRLKRLVVLQLAFLLFALIVS